jgi:hypothetical protein
MNTDDIVYRLRKRAEIRRSITTRKSVQENQPDRIAELLDEAASEIEHLQRRVQYWIAVADKERDRGDRHEQ